MRYTLLVLLFLNYFVYGQNLHHQMLSSQGTSVELHNGVYVSQTIGQQSAIGNSSNSNTIYMQGYQQRFWSKHVSENTTAGITTTTYPNPFVQTVNFQFSRPIKDIIEVSVFDISGKLIFHQKKKPDETILTIELPELPKSSYLVQLSGKNYTYYTQIIKQ